MIVTSRQRPEPRPDGCDRLPGCNGSLKDASTSTNGDVTHPVVVHSSRHPVVLVGAARGLSEGSVGQEREQ